MLSSLIDCAMVPLSGVVFLTSQVVTCTDVFKMSELMQVTSQIVLVLKDFHILQGNFHFCYQLASKSVLTISNIYAKCQALYVLELLLKALQTFNFVNYQRSNKCVETQYYCDIIAQWLSQCLVCRCINLCFTVQLTTTEDLFHNLVLLCD